MSHHVARARLLMAQNRYDGALAELHQQLALEPEHLETTALLCLCLTALNKHEEAVSQGKRAVGLAPDEPLSHYVLGNALLGSGQYKPAQAAAEQAIQLNPFEADFYSLKCQSLLARQQWEPALAAADIGLSLDAEHTGCLNGRIMALVKLGRRDEADRTAQGALERHPDVAFTHANQGWSCLNAGDWRRAREHFLEALRLDPELEFARQGLVESIKGRNLLYRFVLYYQFQMSRLAAATQLMLIVGGMVGVWLLSSLAEQQPALAAWIFPVLVAYVLGVYLIWVAQPVGDLFLRLHPLGKHALSPRQRAGANVVAVCFLAAFASLGLWWSGVLPEGGIGVAKLFALVIPASAIYRCPAGSRRWTMSGVTAALGVAALIPFLMNFPDLLNRLASSKPVLNLLRFGAQNFWMGLALSTWLANGLIMGSRNEDSPDSR